MNKRNPDIVLASIVATAKNRVIGKDNSLIWHIPEDLKHFKRTTMGKPIIMGRKSFESLGKPLPGRANIVISRTSKPQESKPTKTFKDLESSNVEATDKTTNGLHYSTSIRDAIDQAKNIATQSDMNEVFIIGGGQIYAETLPYTDRLYLTVLDRDYEGDTFFPEIKWDEWNIAHKEKHAAEPDHDRPAFTFYTLERKS